MNFPQDVFKGPLFKSVRVLFLLGSRCSSLLVGDQINSVDMWWVKKANCKREEKYPSLNFLICEIGEIRMPTSQDCFED